LHSFIQHFCQLAHGVVNTSDDKIIAAFIAGARNNWCHEELEIREPSTVSELYALVDECVRAEEGRLAPEHAAQAANDLVPTDKKKEARKRASKQILTAEQGLRPTTDKKIKPDAPVVVAAAPTQRAWCPIHETNSHDLKTCHTVYGLAETCNERFVEHQNCGQCRQLLQLWPTTCCGTSQGRRCDQPGRRAWGARGGHGGGRGNPPREPDCHPAAATGEVDVVGEYQEEAAVICIHGGPMSLPSLGAIKCFSREILAAEPGVDQREPL
jgi:hypothetical protein